MFSFIGDLLGGLGSLLLDVVNGLLRGIVVFLTEIVDSLGGITDILEGFKTGALGLWSGFLDLLSLVFPFLPEEWVTVLVTCLLMTIVGVIIKKKVFG